MLKSQNLKKVLLFALFHASFFVILLTIFRPIPGVDVGENFFWSWHFELGYYKHPPLQGWIVGLFGSIFGISVFTNYFICGVFIFVSLVAVYFFAKEFLPENKAFLAVLLLEGLTFAGINARTFNANLVQIPFWILAPLFYIYGVKTRKLLHFGLFGFFLGVSFLGKYFTLLLAFVIFISFLANKQTRSLLKTPLPYFAVLCFFIVISPHLYWLVKNDFPPYNYISGSQIRDCGFFACRKNAFDFIFLSILAFLPILLGLFILFEKAKFKGFNLKNPYNNLLFCLAVLPFAIMSVLSLVTGMFIVVKWSATFFFVLPVFLLYFWDFKERENIRQNVQKFLVLMFTMWFAIIAISGYVDSKQKKEYFEDMKRITKFHIKNFENEFKIPLKYIAGNNLNAGSFVMLSKEKIFVIPENNLAFATYLDPLDVEENGVLIIKDCLISSSCFTPEDGLELKEIIPTRFKKHQYNIVIIYKKPKKILQSKNS